MQLVGYECAFEYCYFSHWWILITQTDTTQWRVQHAAMILKGISQMHMTRVVFFASQLHDILHSYGSIHHDLGLKCFFVYREASWQLLLVFLHLYFTRYCSDAVMAWRIFGNLFMADFFPQRASKKLKFLENWQSYRYDIFGRPIIFLNTNTREY